MTSLRVDPQVKNVRIHAALTAHAEQSFNRQDESERIIFMSFFFNFPAVQGCFCSIEQIVLQ